MFDLILISKTSSNILGCFITGYPSTGDRKKFKFTDWVASIRKDVECFFGGHKSRWRFFKRPSTLLAQIDLENAFFCTCIFHNMILRDDGLDSLWENDVNWDAINPEGEDADHEEGNDAFWTPEVFDVDEVVAPIVVRDFIADVHLHAGDTKQLEFLKLRELLTEHLHFTYERRQLMWPRIRKNCSVDERRLVNGRPREHFPAAQAFNDDAD